MKTSMIKLISSLVLCLLLSIITCNAFAAENQIVRFKGKVKHLTSLDTYGLLSDDERRFHPTKRLPLKFQKDDLEVIVEGNLREDLFGPNMYGKALDVVSISLASQYVSPEDRQAIRLLLLRMDAFNTGDLAKLQQIDVAAKNITAERFKAWIGGNSARFTLNYMETTLPSGPFTDNSKISGFCLYSRERVNGMSISGNLNYALMKFTIAKVDGQWKFVTTGNYLLPDNGVDPKQFVEQLKEKAKEKYGTTNLATWRN
ncbi:MAG: hypothetical protein H6Q73_2871 [Firmicutes bacterium]|nr:hypothetical protein [Bacillota bacterium]